MDAAKSKKKALRHTKASKSPRVAFLIPVYNEAKNIEKCISNLQDQTWKNIEIIVADGRSTDKTVSLVRAMAKEDKRIILVDNPERNTAVGRNRCFQASSAEFIQNYSGHIFIDPDYTKIMVTRLMSLPVDVGAIGCSNRSPQKQSFSARVSDLVFSSLMGGVKGMAQNQRHDKEKFVESIATTMYRRSVMEEVGVFDPTFWVGQDGELNIRVRKAGYKILYTPATVAYQAKRGTLSKFIKQMWRYGVAAIIRIKKHPDSFKPLQLVPSLFVVSVVTGLVLAAYQIYHPLPTLLGIYVITGWISAAIARGSFLEILCSPLYYFCLHFMYGLGFMVGVFRSRFTSA